jgi:hypothetical protein
MRHVLGDTSVAPIYEHWASGLEEANIWAAPAAPRKLEPNPRDGRGGRRR